MTPADVARLEALRATALGAFHAARGVVQTIDAMLMETPEPEPNAFDTFDTTSHDPQPTEARNGKSKKRR